MLIDQTVIINVNVRYIQYWENLGYIIPRYNNSNRLLVKRNTQIEVNIKDLPPKSNVLVKRKCDSCGDISDVVYNTVTDLCHTCATKLKVNENSCRWKGGRPKCIDCNKQLVNIYAKRCTTCVSNYYKGINHPNYKSDLTDREKNRLISGISKWRSKIKIRYKYTCQKCGFVGKKRDGLICAHHIESYSANRDKLLDVDNGITLCKTCHIKFHKKYGNNTNKEQLEQFLKDS